LLAELWRNVGFAESRRAFLPAADHDAAHFRLIIDTQVGIAEGRRPRQIRIGSVMRY
jgi:hypothetical protein